MIEKDYKKLTKFLELTRSNNDGESLSAVRRANEMLDKFNLRWADILKGKIIIQAPKPSDYELLFDYIEEHMEDEEDYLDFILSLKSFYHKKGFLTEKQAKALYTTYERIRGY
jgi:hypothetical protein